VTEPVAILQKLRSAPPTELCRALFFGEVPEGSESDVDLYQRLDCWVSANSHLPMMFNQQQCRALALEALTAAGPVVVQGPPGTGKSHLIAHGLLQQIIQRGGRALVLCNSNSAVDTIAEKVLDVDGSFPTVAMSLPNRGASALGSRSKSAKKCSRQAGSEATMPSMRSAAARNQSFSPRYTTQL